jgi:hypothetical protein
MRTEDLGALTRIGQALWASPEASHRPLQETVAAVSLLELGPERSIERAAGVLLNQVARDGADAAAAAIHRPFFRLLPEERLVLAALHCSRWSYGRIGRVLGRSAENVAEIAWAARLHLAQVSYLPLPFGSSRGASCPEYLPARPWTQSFLDEELEAHQKHFLERHLVSCDSCRQALNSCRSLYYRIDAFLPRLDQTAEDDHADSLARTSQAIHLLTHPGEQTFWGSLRVFARRTDVQLILIGAIGLALKWLL